MPTNNPVLTALAAYPGTYEKKLFSLLYNGLDAFNDVRVIPNLKSKLQMTKLRVNKSAKPYTGDFKASANDMEFLPRELAVERAQRDITIHPDNFRGTFMEGMMGAGSNPGNKKVPFAQYVWQEVIGQLAADVNDRVIWGGLDKTDFSAWDNATTYTAGDLVTFVVDGETRYWRANASTLAAESPVTHPAKWDDVSLEAICEGFGSRLAKAITGNDITPIAIGTIDNSNVYAYAAFKELWRSLPVAYRRNGATIYCSFTDAELLMDDLESQLTKFTRAEVTSTEGFALPGTFGKGYVKPCTWMGETRRIMVSPKENLLIGTDRASDMNTIDTDVHIYTVDAAISFLLGTQVRDFGAMVINDQA